MSPMPGIFCIVEFTELFISPAIANVCPLFSSISVSVRRVLRAGMRKPFSTMALPKSSVLTSGRTFRCTRLPLTIGSEVQADAELLVLDGDRHAAAAALGDRNRELAAGEEAGFLAALGDQVRLGQALEQSLRLQRLDHDAEVVLVIEQEHVEEIAERDLAGRRRHVASPGAAGFRTAGPRTRRRELLRRRPDDVVLDAVRGGEEVDAELGHRAARHLGEPDAEQHLVARRAVAIWSSERTSSFLST